jgi:hypothetical protein
MTTLVIMWLLIRIQMQQLFTGKININKLDNYKAAIPAYITKDNTAGNAIKATLILRPSFVFDKNLSSKNTISCPLHIQSNAF